MAETLGNLEFKGTNGLLNQVRFLATLDSWKERLPEILQGYKKEDVWNLDETRCFWQTLLHLGFSQKVKQCNGGKDNTHKKGQ